MLFSLKRSEILTPVPTWIDLEGIMPREISRYESRNTYDSICMKYQVPTVVKWIETHGRIEAIRG